jgi:hypothetical protein
VYNWIAILRIIVYRWALLKWRMTHRKKKRGGGSYYACSLLRPGRRGLDIIFWKERRTEPSGETRRTGKSPGCVSLQKLGERRKRGWEGGHRSPPLLIRQRRFMWTATGCRANERTGPIHLGSLPLVFPPLFFLFFFLLSIPITRTQWRGQSWVRTPYGLFFLFFLRSSSLPSRRWNISALGVSNI